MTPECDVALLVKLLYPDLSIKGGRGGKRFVSPCSTRLLVSDNTLSCEEYAQWIQYGSSVHSRKKTAYLRQR